MKLMLGAVSRVLCAVCLVLAAASSAFATTSVLSIPTNLTGDHGTTATVPISVAPGAGILGIDMTVNYDPAVLQIQSAAVSGVAQAAGFGFAANTSNPGRVIITEYATSNAIASSGEVARIKFTVIGVGGNTSALTITNFSINEGQIPAAAQNGSFTVTPLPMILSLPAANGDPGLNVDVPLSASNANGAVNVTATVQFSSSVVTAQSVTISGIAAAAGWTASSNLATPGVASFTLSGGTALSGAGELAKIRFHVVGAQSATTALTFTSFSVNGGALPAQAQNGSFTINPVTVLLSLPSDAVGSNGSTVQVPLSATPGDSICRIDATIQYDPSVIVADNVTVSGIAAAAGFGVTSNTATPGTITLSTFQTSACLAGSGEVLRIQFHVVGPLNATSPMTFTSASVNNGQLPSAFHQGQFTVVAFCATAPDGTSCNDMNACTQTDTCQGGVCVGSNPVSCLAQDSCHVGVCNPSDGTCSQQVKPDGTVCDDGNACTQSDSCLSGTCVGGSPVVCAASDSCHAAGTCDSQSGTCSNPAKPDGTACNDGNACTQTDTCQSGTCTGTNPVACTASDACHVAGTCNPATGTCSNPNAPNGTSCNDHDACTQTDTCQNGACFGGNPVICASSDQCHVAGTCDPASGTCSNPSAPDGTACNDGNGCTQTDTCQSGACSGSNPVVCTASDQCHAAGTCDPSSGSCSNPSLADGTACDDGNACTRSDSCQSGTCTGTNPVICTSSDECHVAGTCDPGTGTCSNPNAPNGTACGAGNACSTGDSCQDGVCAAGAPVVCTRLDQCHVAGVCVPATGQCTNPAVPNGTACNDRNACTQTDTCQAGMCRGSNPVICTVRDQCHVAGACDPANGTCSNPNAEDGTACEDGSACTQADTCQGGSCSPGAPVICKALDQCHVAGSCDPSSGACSNPSAADGSACNDGDPCTAADACGAGTCTGTPITAPPETQNLTVAADKATYTWSGAAYATQYDVVRGSVAAFPVGPGGADETCFGNLSGTTLADPDIPVSGTGYWYLSRGENACGVGSFGTQSDGSPRATTSCP